MGAIEKCTVGKRFRRPVVVGIDGGGTNFRIRAYPVKNDGELRKKDVFNTRLKTDDYTKVTDLVSDVLEQSGKLRQQIKGMGFGLAGAFQGSRVKLTNQPEWEPISLFEVAETFGIPYVGGVNDLEATAYGIVACAGLDDYEESALINQGVMKGGNEAVLAPGTGLGEAIIIDGKLPVATEGGHADFAPTNDIQVELLKYLQDKYKGAICYEDVLSGNGLVDIYELLCNMSDSKTEFLQDVVDKKQKAALIAEAANAGSNRICGAALKIFIEVLGAEASNLALKSLATRGVYIGGTAKDNLPFIMENRDAFMNAFTFKRKQRKLVENIPVSVIIKEDVNEYGAAYFVAGKISK